MIGGPPVVAGLDVGSSKTCAVILEGAAEEGGPERVLGVGLASTEGMRREEVTDLEATTRCIRASLTEAEEMAGVEIRTPWVGLAGGHVEMATSAGVVAVSGAEVTGGDVDRVHEVGRAVVLPPDRVLLHAIPQEYVLDGRRGIEAPVGMSGTRLETEVCVITAGAASCDDLRKAVDRAGYGIEELVAEPLAGSLAVLREKEREGGVALVDVGEAATDLAVFQGGRIRHLSSMRWGGGSVTSDIVKGLGVPEEAAESLKQGHGSALTERVDPEERVEVAGAGPNGKRRVSRELLSHIIEQRMDEVFGLVYDRLDAEGLLRELSAGVVLTGGGVGLADTVELGQRVFNLPVRLGRPGDGLAGFVDAVRKPKFATAVGLGLYGLMRRRQRGGPATRIVSRVGDWFREFF